MRLIVYAGQRMLRRAKRWLRRLWHGWEYRKVGGQWMLACTRPLSKKALAAARKDAAVALPLMNATDDLFQTVTDGRLTFTELAEKLPGAAGGFEHLP